MNKLTKRNTRRVQTDLDLRSVSLPGFTAKILDASERGVRVQLKGEPSKNFQESRIRFGLSLPGQCRVQFEGYARVAWVNKSEQGFEAGLEWERLTEAQWLAAQAILFLGDAA